MSHMPWNIKDLLKVPRVYPAPGFSESGVKALFYEGLPLHGKPTKVFAWYGIPEKSTDGRFPAMVLVHGGGGTAFAEWVRLWTSRGYAAIAMDTGGCTAGGEHAKRPRHKDGGPAETGRFDEINEPPENQWPYHAVADVILAHSLIRSFPEIDPQRIGITGASWGAYLTCIAVSLDDRFKVAVPIYGCGFLGDDSGWLNIFKQMGKEKSSKWLNLWDPSVYLRTARLPMLWVTGTNDEHFPMNSLQKTYRLPAGEVRLCIRIRMPHAHGGPAENPEEIHAFVNSFLKGGPPLAGVSRINREKDIIQASFIAEIPIAAAELIFTCDRGNWPQRYWQSIAAQIDSSKKIIYARVPDGASACYFNLTDSRNCAVSTEHVEIIGQ